MAAALGPQIVTNFHKLICADMCGYVQSGGASLLFLAVERCRTAANRFFFFFDRIYKINRIGVGVVYIL